MDSRIRIQGSMSRVPNVILKGDKIPIHPRHTKCCEPLFLIAIFAVGQCENHKFAPQNPTDGAVRSYLRFSLTSRESGVFRASNTEVKDGSAGPPRPLSWHDTPREKLHIGKLVGAMRIRAHTSHGMERSCILAPGCEKKYLDPDFIWHQTVFCISGSAAMPFSDVMSLKSFRSAGASGVGGCAFGGDCIQELRFVLRLSFHYCPPLSAHRQIGIGREDFHPVPINANWGEGFYGIFTIHFQTEECHDDGLRILLRDTRPTQPSIKRAATVIAGFINTLPGSFAMQEYQPKNTVNDKVIENYNGQPKQDKRADRDPDVVSILQNGMLATQHPNVTSLFTEHQYSHGR
ncbi:hypothetical protein PAAG_02849 [Paracoccidioides lutzii Pb01]|uniref:Uncharacterized protein n=1 Tax=Paracoccidioides lutzii (strain ATCC MYA-826 / Pb01) TaxID=502779 RepID=C1GWF4_PARBA|nr:hypothetical protein PAAG_02849 [Paracoccidioides lutzii Pb01]EEH40873.2 hypothetical protein PAAG_02849 [Paracoccidioides lutzii Pb01]